MLENLRGKKIALLGFGKEGQATFAYLVKHGLIPAAVLDMSEDLKPDQTELINKHGVKFTGGKDYLDGLDEYDVLFRSPGLPRSHPKLLSFKNPKYVLSQIKLFFEICPCPIIAVTGTKGKTTTTSLIYEILKAAGKKVFLGGNIGQPPLDFADDLGPDSLVVLEISSFQSQDLHKSPHIGVILIVTEDHIGKNRLSPASHKSKQEYVAAKAQLIANQTENDFAVLHPDLPEEFKNSGKGKKVFFDIEEGAKYDRRILGKHNTENIAAAAAVCKLIGVNEMVIRQSVAAFKGIPQRLEVIAEKDGIKYVNDSASTNPDSTAAAVDSFHESIILIVGGSDKGLDYTEFGKKIISTPQIKGLVVIGEVAQKIIKAVYGFQGQVLTGATSMHEIIEQARSIAKKGDVILLSPAAASFDMFLNSKDRGEQFNRLVQSP